MAAAIGIEDDRLNEREEKVGVVEETDGYEGGARIVLQAVSQQDALAKVDRLNAQCFLDF